jgi:hypothetical protein
MAITTAASNRTSPLPVFGVSPLEAAGVPEAEAVASFVAADVGLAVPVVDAVPKDAVGDVIPTGTMVAGSFVADGATVGGLVGITGEITGVFVGLRVGVAVAGGTSLVGVIMGTVAVGFTASAPVFRRSEIPPMARSPTRISPTNTMAPITKGLRRFPGCRSVPNMANPLLNPQTRYPRISTLLTGTNARSPPTN